MNVSVVVCTRNRADQLGEFLQSATALIVPHGLVWELIVVDNGSTDHTARVVESFASRLPVRYVREDEAGLSNARNRGVEAAMGDYICWTDDDVSLDPEWLSAYVTAFRTWPDAAIFGGRVIPVLLPPTPAWFARAADEWPVATVVARRDFGDQPIELDARRLPFGASFAVRAANQKRHLYNPGLGVSPVHARLGEETDVMGRIMAEGGVARWVPEAKVEHVTQSSRQTVGYIYRYFRSVGDTWAFLQHTQPERNFMGANADADCRWFGAPPSVIKTIIKHGTIFALKRFVTPPRQWIADLRLLAIGMGALDYWRRERSS
jgi:glucosyl-dolichyl phosphate glucuronosyltransferase